MKNINSKVNKSFDSINPVLIEHQDDMVFLRDYTKKNINKISSTEKAWLNQTFDNFLKQKCSE